MGRIEELPDDFDESLDLNKAPVFTPPAAKEPSFLPSGETPFGIKRDAWPKETAPAPAMPPAMESVKSHTADEIIELMNQTPLFMTDVEKALQAGASLFYFLCINKRNKRDERRHGRELLTLFPMTCQQKARMRSWTPSAPSRTKAHEQTTHNGSAKMETTLQR